MRVDLNSKWLSYLGLLVLLLVFPFVAPTYLLHLGIMVGIFCILSISLNLVGGFAGQMSLGHAAFWAIGAYTSALLTVRLGWPVWFGLPAAGFVTALFSLFLGLPSIRVSDIYLAIVTISFGLIVQILAFNLDPITGGAHGIYNVPRPVLGPWNFTSREEYYLLVLLVLVVTVILTERIVNSHVGRALVAIREDAVAAASMGINITYYKILAFVVSAFFAGMAGSLYAHYFRFINPDAFTIMVSINILVMIVVGGLASIPGSIIGALVVYLLPEALRFLGLAYYAVFGAFLILMVIFVPDGLVSLWDRFAPRLITRWANSSLPGSEEGGPQLEGNTGEGG